MVVVHSHTFRNVCLSSSIIQIIGRQQLATSNFCLVWQNEESRSIHKHRRKTASPKKEGYQRQMLLTLLSCFSHITKCSPFSAIGSGQEHLHTHRVGVRSKISVSSVAVVYFIPVGICHSASIGSELPRVVHNPYLILFHLTGLCTSATLLTSQSTTMAATSRFLATTKASCSTLLNCKCEKSLVHSYLFMWAVALQHLKMLN